MSRPLVLLMALALSVPIAGAAPKVKDKAPPIVGVWVVESRTFAGRVATQPAIATRIVFRADGTYTFVVNGQDPDPDGHRYKLDPSADPARIDFVPREKPAYLGIFQIEKDTLTLCYNPAGEPPPTAFESAAGSMTTQYILKRVKKD